MCSEQLLPQMLDPRWILAVEQFKQRFRERLRDARIDSLEIAPASDAVIGLDLHIDNRPDPICLERRDANRRSPIGNLRAGSFFLRDSVIDERDPSRRSTSSRDKIATRKRLVVHGVTLGG